MAKFFRGFRVESIQLQKFRNYFFYAIGEIVLVAFGILLALKVGEWNEDQNNITKRSVYYKNLVHDLAEDTTLIAKQQVIWQQSLDEIKDFTDYSTQQNSIDSLLAHVERISVFFSAIENFNTSTYETLIATGDIKLMDDSVTFWFKKIKEEQMHHLDVFRKEQDVYLSAFTNYGTNFPFKTSIIRNPTVHRQLWKNTNKEKALIAYRYVMFSRRLMFGDAVRITGYVKDYENKLISYLVLKRKNS
jgi:hypothetical protein